MRISDIREAGEEVVRLLDTYTGRGSRGELAADGVLFGFLKGKFGHMTRQHRVMSGRIDFRYGTSNPVVIELAVRGRGEARAKLLASQNRSELSKLTRVRPTTAKKRVLLLLDRSTNAIPKEELKEG